MEKIKKIVKKGYSNKSGYVQYSLEFDYNVTISDVSGLFMEIQKDFPNVTDKQVDIRIEEKQLNLIFFTFDLPEKDSGLFDEEHYMN